MPSIIARKPLSIRRRRKYNTLGYKYFSFDVNYGGPDTYTYFFKARSLKDVSTATGIERWRISECTNNQITNAILHGKHIDTVINGRLIEQDC